MPHAHISISTMLMVHVELLVNNYRTNVGDLVSVMVEGPFLVMVYAPLQAISKCKSK